MMMSSSFPLVVVFGVLAVVSSCNCFVPQVYYVGGDDGWVVEPKVKYDEWAAKTKFHVQDKLVFKYREGKDSVLLVNQVDFTTCNKTLPIRRMTSGETVVVLDRPSNFYFISGKHSHCDKGQRLDVSVVGDVQAHSPSPAPEKEKVKSGGSGLGLSWVVLVVGFVGVLMA